MRFTFLTALYSSYVTTFYRQRPGLVNASYAEQKAALDQDGFAWNGALDPVMTPLGYEVQSIYANVGPLQRAWAAEHGLTVPITGWIEEIARQQILAFRPDVLWIDNLTVFRGRWIGEMREKCPALRRVIGFTGVDLYDVDTARACDAMLACTRYFVDFFQQAGIKSHLFRHGFNQAVLSRLEPMNDCAEEVLFSGSIARGEGAHLARERLIGALVDVVPTRIYCPQGEISPQGDWAVTNSKRGLYLAMQLLNTMGVGRDHLRRLPKIGRAADWRKMPLSQINPRLYSRMRPPVYGLDMFSTLRRYAVTLNKHIDLARSEAGNCRLFEATGAGACLLTDWKENMSELFEPDREVVTYRSDEECVEKARWLLAHPAERAAIAQAGQSRVLREHSFECRAQELDQLIRRKILV